MGEQPCYTMNVSPRHVRFAALFCQCGLQPSILVVGKRPNPSLRVAWANRVPRVFGETSEWFGLLPFLDRGFLMTLREFLDNWPRLRACRSGEVYLLGTECGVYKIGRTWNVSVRMRHIKPPPGVDGPLVCLWHRWFRNCTAVEEYLHKRFCDKRYQGEWFVLSSKDIAYIKECRDER